MERISGDMIFCDREVYGHEMVFCTDAVAWHYGSPIGVAMDKIRLHCQSSAVLDGLTANGGVNVESWVKKLGYGK